MPPERSTNIRDWVTNIASVITMLLVPLGYIILDRQKLQIEHDASQLYTEKQEFNQRMLVQDATDKAMWNKIGELTGKLDTIVIGQAHLEDSVAAMKEALKEKKTN
jgi:hypothetical protein